MNKIAVEEETAELEDDEDIGKKENKSEVDYSWAVGSFDDYRQNILEHSGKMVVLMALIEETVRQGEKILIFSQSLLTLQAIETFLSSRTFPHPGCTDKWAKDKHYFRE